MEPGKSSLVIFPSASGGHLYFCSLRIKKRVAEYNRIAGAKTFPACFLKPIAVQPMNGLRRNEDAMENKSWYQQK